MAAAGATAGATADAAEETAAAGTEERQVLCAAIETADATGGIPEG